MSLNMTVDQKKLKQLVKSLSPKNFDKEMKGAIASALNRTLDYVNTKLGRVVTGIYSVKTTDVKKTVKKYKAKKGDLSAKLQSKGRTLSLVNFPHKPETTIMSRSLGSKHPKAQVKVKVKKGSMQPVTVDPKAFLQKANGTYNIFKRLGEERKPIVVLNTLSIPQMITNETVDADIQKMAQQKMNERLSHEIDFRLSKIQKALKG